jgi:hypothetical protein
LKRTLAALTIGIFAIAGVTLGSPAAASMPASTTVPLAASAAASPTCSGTYGFGKLKYQVCVRWNCDSTFCLMRAYGGIINTATGPRHVEWSIWDDRGVADDGRVTIQAGKQYTTPLGVEWRELCNSWKYHWMRVQYGGSGGWSPDIEVKTYMPCR